MTDGMFTFLILKLTRVANQSRLALQAIMLHFRGTYLHQLNFVPVSTLLSSSIIFLIEKYPFRHLSISTHPLHLTTEPPL
ncbi:hypothetical protein HanIR_Chr16g0797631 [Helianthus annuus]|nr:hypothetical protein HanIR_Chr16g0797631 [Helianthus annuus]